MPTGQRKGKVSRAPDTAAERLKDKAALLQRLGEALDESGMTQSELAKRIGCTPSTVTEWFNRESLPKGHLMMYLPRVLDVSGSWLLSDEGPVERPGNKPKTSEYVRGARWVLGRVEADLDELQRDLLKQGAAMAAAVDHDQLDALVDAVSQRLANPKRKKG